MAILDERLGAVVRRFRGTDRRGQQRFPASGALAAAARPPGLGAASGLRNVKLARRCPQRVHQVLAHCQRGSKRISDY